MLVVAAVPSGRTWQPAMGTCFASMCALATRDGIGVGILSLEGTWVANARNVLAQQALDNSADYILFVDDDMVFPPDSMHRLLEHQRDIIGVRYSHRGNPYGVVGLLEDETQEYGAAKAKILGTGLILIKTSVFERLSRPWFMWTETHSDDVYFIMKAKDAGVDAWCDLDLSNEVGHIGTHMFTLKGFKPEGYGVKAFSKINVGAENGQQNCVDSR
jgi:hypothetical protein